MDAVTRAEGTDTPRNIEEAQRERDHTRHEADKKARGRTERWTTNFRFAEIGMNGSRTHKEETPRKDDVESMEPSRTD